jgi:hypothetical protein
MYYLLFSTATMVARTRLTVTLHVYSYILYIACLVYVSNKECAAFPLHITTFRYELQYSLQDH